MVRRGNSLLSRFNVLLIQIPGVLTVVSVGNGHPVVSGCGGSTGHPEQTRYRTQRAGAPNYQRGFHEATTVDLTFFSLKARGRARFPLRSVIIISIMNWTRHLYIYSTAKTFIIIILFGI
jgi:hypothetical protein